MDRLLSTIHSPADLKKLDRKQLPQLASEIRSRIISALSKTGGHLASNLGTIELTLAMHYVFSSPEDKFIFDTSHQTYTHKILTNRNDRLETIRQYKGLSGFADPSESEHDHFYAGHAGTALSLALGAAKARDLSHEESWILPILGDAALTCGLSLEALNNIPKTLSKFILIVNDNAMSISKNVGAITTILSRFINSPTANRVYQDIEHLLAKIPGYGETISRSGHKVRESIKNLVSTAPYFEQFGLSYTGPIDGHDIDALIDAFLAIKEIDGPVALHIHTTKGKGLESAMENPTVYHGVKSFDPLTGKMHPGAPSNPTFPKIFGSHMLALFQENPNLVTISPAMLAGSCLQPVIEAYPERCIDVGIAEGHAVTFAAGIAKNPRLKVCVSIYSTFSQRAFDNIYHDVCLQNLPVIFAFDRGGIAGGDGVTHNGIYDIGFLRGMPNLIIAQPRNGIVLRELISSSLTWNAPSVIRYPNLATEDGLMTTERHVGTGEVLAVGKELVIISLGHMDKLALALSKMIESEFGISPTVIDPVFLAPLDVHLLDSVFSTHSFVLTIEEHAVSSGMGSIINDFIISRGYTHLTVHNAGIGEYFVEHGDHQSLLKEAGLTAEALLATVREKCTALSSCHA